LNSANAKKASADAYLAEKKANDIDVDNAFELMAARKGKLSAVEMD
jgi:hypothetical protein